jgi:ribosome-binding factor A
MPTPIRQKRVAERIQHEVAQLIQQEMKDPRLEMVSVTRVVIDRELAHANIFVSAIGGEARRKEVMQVLEGAAGFIRREIGRRVKLRNTPHVVIHWDPGPEKVEQVAQLLDQLKESETAPPATDDAAP